MKKLLIPTFLIILLIGCSTAGQQVKLLNKSNDPEPFHKVERIAEQYPANDIMSQGYKYYIIDQDIPNAFVDSQNKRLFIYKGLIDKMTDQELAVIIFHENAHVKLGHADKRIATAYATTIAFQIANIFVPGVGYANYAVNPLLTNAYSRSQESDADKDAIETGKQFGIKPDVYISALEKLRNHAASMGRGTDSTGLFDSHPNLEYRIIQIKKIKENE